MTPSPSPTAGVELELRGLHCAGCVAAVEAALQRVPGVQDATVNLATQRATVQPAPDAGPLDPAALVAAVRRAGYQAEIPSADAAPPQTDLRRERWRLLAATILALPVLAGHFGLGMLPWPVAAVLTAATVVLAGGPMLAGALRALASGTTSMDVLVSLGVLVALGSSVYGIARHIHELVLFDAATMIVLFVALGKHLEALARGQALAALSQLGARLPATAHRVTPNGTESVPLAAVHVGDRLRVPPHTVVPVDGEVTAGIGALDESLLTGESLPASHRAGDRVLGGTLLVDGELELTATATGAASAAARLARLVEETQALKPPWQRFADRAARIFVPAVLVLAAVTFVGWRWLAGADAGWAVQRMIAVLVVACPCAMGLAIPTAVLVGTTRAARLGVLVRDPAALEAAGQLRELVLDKTGTLTVGRPLVTRIATADGWTEADVLRLAAGPARLSPHPLAQALLLAAEQRRLVVPSVTDFVSSIGGGVRGRVDGQDVLVGSAAWLAERGINDHGLDRPAKAWALDGLSVVFVAVDGRVAGLFGFTDQLHPEAAAALTALRELGVQARILSGDREPAVRAVAQQLGIDTYEAQLSPNQKLVRVQALAAAGRGVGMVGDGINDAPALAAADVGIAIGAGSDLARAAAPICLVGHSPRLVPEAIRVSRASGRVMRQNLFWAVAYNLVMVPIAMLTPLPPALATAAMMCSSLTVVCNALRLRRA